MNILRFERNIRVSLAVAIGVCVIFATWHASHETGAIVMLTESLHSVSDVLGFIIYLIAINLAPENSKEQMIGKVSGLALLIASAATLYKALEKLFTDGSTLHGQTSLLLTISIFTIVCVLLQMKLISKEHAALHGHHEHAAHSALNYELFADLLQASIGLLLYLAVIILPGNNNLISLTDVGLTILVSAWMFWRGYVIVFSKKECSHKHKH